MHTCMLVFVSVLRRVGKERKLGESNFSEIKTGNRYLKDWGLVLSDRLKGQIWKG